MKQQFLRAIIIEDEKLARDLLKNYLKDFDEIQIIDECADGFSGIKSININKPDLVFLDIQMPKLTGFEMLELLDFTPKFLFGTIIRFIGQVLWNIGWFAIEDLWIMVVIGVVLIIVGSILRFIAWRGIETFFRTNAQLFPPNISEKGSSGGKLCKISTIFDMTMILSFVGEILRIIGYFKLASTKDLIGAPAQTISQPIAPQPVATSAASAPSANFCPNCGSSVSSGARFCPECGSAMN